MTATGDVIRPHGSLIEMPFVGQSELMCGAAAVVMSLRYWGDDVVEPEAFADLVRVDAGGILASDLVSRTRSLGWEVTSFVGTIELLGHHTTRGRPVTTLIRVGADRFHFVTVVGLLGDRVVFHDPAVSPYRSMRVDEFDAAWGSAGHWAALVLPGGRVERRGAAAGEDRPAVEEDRGDAEKEPAVSEPALTGSRPESRCAERLRAAAVAARADDLVRADSIMDRAGSACPDDIAVLREVAALRLRQGRHGDAIAAAESALRLSPNDRWARELLAGARYLAGDQQGAVAAWSTLDRSRLARVELASPTRTRQDVVVGLAALEEGESMSGGDLEGARRRLGMLPAAANTRVDVRPLSGGRVAAEIGVAERPVVPRSVPDLAVVGTRALFGSQLRLQAAAPLRAGELWTLDWRWDPPRRAYGVTLEIPGRFAGPGVWSASGRGERETYAGRSGAESVEVRRFARVGFRARPTAALGWLLSLGAERWRAGGVQPALSAAVELGSPEEPGGRAGASLSTWIPSGDAPGFSRVDAVADWRSDVDRRGVTMTLGGGISWATAEARRPIWPGAGTGHGRPALARAHPLLTAGVVTGPLFGRGLVHGGLESVIWAGHAWLAELGAAVFIDGAWSLARRPGAPGQAFHVDAGLGARLGLPGDATLRFDFGYGLRDGASAWSVSLDRPLDLLAPR